MTENFYDRMADWCHENQLPKDAMLHTFNSIIQNDECAAESTVSLSAAKWLEFFRIGSPTSARLVEERDGEMHFTIRIDHSTIIAITIGDGWFTSRVDFGSA